MRRSQVVLDPLKDMLRVFWTASKTFLEKHVSREFITNHDAFVNVGH